MAYALGFPKNITDLLYDMRVWMPKRPGHRSRKTSDAFMMDFENSLLTDWTHTIPTGVLRFEKDAWSQLVKRNVFPNHSDVDWDEYCQWVNQGGGDDWFQGDELD